MIWLKTLYFLIVSNQPQWSYKNKRWIELITTKLGVPIKIQLEIQGAATQPSYIQLDFGPPFEKQYWYTISFAKTVFFIQRIPS